MKTLANLTVAAALATVFNACANDGPAMDVPGYRPECEGAERFLAEVGTSRIAVLPAVVRTRQGTRFSAPSQKAAVDFLKEHGLGRPEARKIEPDLGEPEGQFQFALFQSDMQKLGPITSKLPDHDYSLTIVQLVTPTPDQGLAVGGIHIYLLDAQGSNAFSFLLNSHHKALNDAKLRSAAAADKDLDALVVKATAVALESLRRQVQDARGDGDAPASSSP